MATTAPDLAAEVVDRIESSGVRYAILHGEAELAAGETISDIDLVVDRPPAEVIVPLLDDLAAGGIHLVQRWAYDWSTLTLFFVGAEPGRGAQVDLAHDPRGRGRYGFLPDPLIERRVRGVSRWRIDDDDLLLYLLRKRQEKRDADAVEALRSELGDRVEVLRRRAGQVLSPSSAAHARALLDGRPTPWAQVLRRRAERGGVTAIRHGQRLRNPTGLVVPVPGRRRDLDDLVADLGAVLRDVRVVEPTGTTAEAARIRSAVLRGTVVLAAERPPSAWGAVAEPVGDEPLRPAVVSRLETHARAGFGATRRSFGRLPRR